MSGCGCNASNGGCGGGPCDCYAPRLYGATDSPPVAYATQLGRPGGAVGANPLLYPGETPAPVFFPPSVPGPAFSLNPAGGVQTYFQTLTPAPAAPTGVSAGVVLLAVAAVAAIGGVAYWSYKQSYSRRTVGSRTESTRPARTYRPSARRPSTPSRRRRAENRRVTRR